MCVKLFPEHSNRSHPEIYIPEILQIIAHDTFPSLLHTSTSRSCSSFFNDPHCSARHNLACKPYPDSIYTTVTEVRYHAKAGGATSVNWLAKHGYCGEPSRIHDRRGGGKCVTETNDKPIAGSDEKRRKSWKCWYQCQTTLLSRSMRRRKASSALVAAFSRCSCLKIMRHHYNPLAG